jgi:hypothetical protein
VASVPAVIVAALERVVRIALFLLSVVTGIVMWQQAKLRKLLVRTGGWAI